MNNDKTSKMWLLLFNVNILVGIPVNIGMISPWTNSFSEIMAERILKEMVKRSYLFPIDTPLLEEDPWMMIPSNSSAFQFELWAGEKLKKSLVDLYFWFYNKKLKAFLKS
jgi:hypothetical protein